jgi:aryl sulfotransferase
VSGIVWLSSYPKSGNTWLRVLLANFLRDGGEPVDINEISLGPSASARWCFDEWAGIEGAALDPRLIDRLRPQVYRCLARDADETLFIKVHDQWTRVGSGEPMFPADVTRGVVYIIRNPLDLAASCAHHWGTSIAAAVDKLCDSSAGAMSGSRGAPEQLAQHFGSWSDHVRSWTDESSLPVHVVRYEDLDADPERCFRGVLRFCGLDDDPGQVGKAVRFSSFSELRRQEAVAGFRERSPAAPGGFFRRGEVGSWRDELSPELAKRLVTAHGQTMSRFGYAR